MIKKAFLILFFICFNLSNAQSNEIVTVTCNYLGDNFDFIFEKKDGIQTPLEGEEAVDVTFETNRIIMKETKSGGEMVLAFDGTYSYAGEIDNDVSCKSDLFGNNTPSIDVVLISYEDKTSSDNTSTCELEFAFTNNSYGTLHELKIATESYDDREEKIDDYAFELYINAFGGFFNDLEEIKVGNSATSKSLHLKSKCKYIEKIYLTKVDNKYCNIRMLPENINCLDLVNIRSDIKHINFLKK